MGSSATKEESKGDVGEMENSNGDFHVLEVHGGSAAIVVLLILGLLGVAAAVCCCGGPITRLINQWQQRQRLTAIQQAAQHARELRIAEEAAQDHHQQAVEQDQHRRLQDQRVPPIELDPSRQAAIYHPVSETVRQNYPNIAYDASPQPAVRQPQPRPSAPTQPAGVWDAVTTSLHERARTPAN